MVPDRQLKTGSDRFRTGSGTATDTGSDRFPPYRGENRFGNHPRCSVMPEPVLRAKTRREIALTEIPSTKEQSQAEICAFLHLRRRGVCK
jgi:hypothetical protein